MRILIIVRFPDSFNSVQIVSIPSAFYVIYGGALYIYFMEVDIYKIPHLNFVPIGPGRRMHQMQPHLINPQRHLTIQIQKSHGKGSHNSNPKITWKGISQFKSKNRMERDLTIQIQKSSNASHNYHNSNPKNPLSLKCVFL